MSIAALVLGKLTGKPEQRTAKSGRPFTTAKLRTAAGDETVFVHVVCFSESTQAVLLALADGDSVAVAGDLTPQAWLDREGKARPSLDLVAHQVLTTYALKRKRAATEAASERQGTPAGRESGRQQRQPDQDDFGNGADPWLDGGLR